MIEGNGIWDLLAGWLYSIDAADNLFPSIHCLVSWFCFLGIKDQKRIPTWYKGVSFTLAVLVFLSTIFTKQHVLVDVAGGVILAQVCFILGQKTKLWHIYERFGTKIEKKDQQLYRRCQVMKSRKKIIFNGVFLAVVFALTIYGVFHGEDLSSMMDAIHRADKRWLLPGIALVAFFIWGESIIIWYMMRSSGIHLKKEPAFCFRL